MLPIGRVLAAVRAESSLLIQVTLSALLNEQWDRESL